jgi:prolyl-tRNA synthetase
MRQSQLFSKTSRAVSADEVSVNARLLTQAGFIDKQMAGVYSFLPLGYLVIKNIEQIIREEINSIGGQEMIMTALQPKELWQKTNRWQTPEEIMFKMTDPKGEPLVGLAWTHEEPITEIAKRFISSYRDLPRAVYQFQTKFRNEPRAKSGIIRMREFVMKDLYSFHATVEDMDQYYEQVKQAYLRIFDRCGLQAKVVEASGGAFTKQFSHEFQVLTEAGEDYIVYCQACSYAQNKDVAQAKVGEQCPVCGEVRLLMGKSVEVGNIFKLGTKFSTALGLVYTDAAGQTKPVVMASYGISPGRTMGTIVEVHHDDRGIIWPTSVAPYQIHLLRLGETSAVKQQANEIYKQLEMAGLAVLFDDRDESAGIKFADADLIGLPWRLIVSEKTGQKIEIKARGENEANLMTLSEILNKFSVR